MRHMIARVLIMLLLLIAPHPGPAAAREPRGMVNPVMEAIKGMLSD